MKYQFDRENHIHLLDGQPLHGTSTVVKEVMPPFLAKWGAQCAVDSLKEGGKKAKDGVTVTTELLDSAVLAWSKVRDAAADKGTDMHAELEKYVKACLEKEGGKPLVYGVGGQLEGELETVAAFSKWSVENVSRFIFAEAHSFSKDVWVGGIIDCLARMKNGEIAVIDFKSSKEAYFNQFVQCAGYALQLDESGWGDFDGRNWFHSGLVGSLIVIPFGAKTFKPERIENVAGFKDVFKNVVEVYKYQQAFRNK